MTAKEFYGNIFLPAVEWCKSVPGWNIPFNPASDVEMMAIAGQESGWTWTTQQGGPAVGYWQFERNGGVRGVLLNGHTGALAAAACKTAGIEPTAQAAYAALATHPTLACAFARLLLWSDAAPLPDVDDADGGWTYYLRNWRPGLPGPARWPQNHQQAMEAVTGRA